MNPDQAMQVGFLVFGLAALLGIGAGFVGLFVLRVEFAPLVRRVESLEKRPAAGE